MVWEQKVHLIQQFNIVISTTIWNWKESLMIAGTLLSKVTLLFTYHSNSFPQIFLLPSLQNHHQNLEHHGQVNNIRAIKCGCNTDRTRSKVLWSTHITKRHVHNARSFPFTTNEQITLHYPSTIRDHFPTNNRYNRNHIRFSRFISPEGWLVSLL